VRSSGGPEAVASPARPDQLGRPRATQCSPTYRSNPRGNSRASTSLLSITAKSSATTVRRNPPRNSSKERPSLVRPCVLPQAPRSPVDLDRPNGPPPMAGVSPSVASGTTPRRPSTTAGVEPAGTPRQAGGPRGTARPRLMSQSRAARPHGLGPDTRELGSSTPACRRPSPVGPPGSHGPRTPQRARG
jgi:hypothetical protein